MLLADLAQTSARVAATRSRTAKVAELAELLRRADPEESPVVAGYLAGRLPQRRTGVGWRALSERPPPAAEPTLTVAETDRFLEALSQVSGKGAQERRRALLAELLGTATEPEQDFLVRLIGGELRQGALDALAVEGLAEAVGVPPDEVRRAVMLGGSLGEVARALLREGAPALERFRLQVGRPVQPMLAQTARTVAEALDRLGPSAIEEKLDGVRVQAHRQGETVRIYTRTLDEITDRLPEVVEAVRELPAESLVLDGEVIALGEDGRPHAFQDIASRVGSRLDVASAQRTLPLSAVFFDLLNLDGRDLLQEPARSRHTELARLLPERLRIRHMVVEAVQDEQARAAAEDFAEGCLARGHEGVMLKSLDSDYRAGRRGASWLKVKPVHTLDLVVLGAEWGHGRRTGKLSNLHLGARAEDGSWAMLGKTFKGLTDVLLDWQTRRLPELASDEHPWGLRVRPELVVEIAFDGVQRSTRYPAGVTLRFARVLRYREDLTPEDADSVEAVRRHLPGGGG
ncbi:ATP-dependent DNA ligase [Streptomyces sp. NPDC005438]|uniref:ATP-dependent DNA ligase n=1 Tax=Streptomyces sp. NPDC005438 TaxID=3156880 RepID=UPI0033B769A9